MISEKPLHWAFSGLGFKVLAVTQFQRSLASKGLRAFVEAEMGFVFPRDTGVQGFPSTLGPPRPVTTCYSSLHFSKLWNLVKAHKCLFSSYYVLGTALGA